VKLVIISDTHNRHDQIKVPDGDVLIHCGDATMMGQVVEVGRFAGWLAGQPHKYKIFVPGNHDIGFEQNPNVMKSILPGHVVYLEDRGIEIEGVKFYGMPWVPKFQEWAFMLPRGSELMQHKVSLIPDDVEVLITHGPPRGILDLSSYGNENAGCDDLLTRVIRLSSLKVMCFGHIHTSYGRIAGGGFNPAGDSEFINAAICNDAYEVANEPQVVEI
jgi:Icc-related predicted phosphoesterase